jgi:predicted phosphodiesterase
MDLCRSGLLGYDGAMRFGFISDVHGDIEGLTAALDKLAGVDQVICLGDVSGGRHSEACFQLLRKLSIPGVPGNHDLWDFELVGLSESSREYLSQRPVELRMADFLAVHSQYRVDGAEHHFSYIHSELDAQKMWERFDDRLIFFGHTHLAQFHWLEPSGKAGFSKARPVTSDAGCLVYEFALEPAHRYLINVGPVGECCVVYDSQRSTVQYRFTERALPSVKPTPPLETAKTGWLQRLLGRLA